MYSKARLVATLILLALLAHTFSVGSINLQASDPGVPLGELPQDRKPPQESVAACTGKAEEDACAFTTPHRGLESGTCALSQEGLACAPQRENQPERRPEGEGPDGSQSPADRLPPGEAVDACIGKAEEDVCEFTTPQRGLESGTCSLSQEGLACAPQRGEQPERRPEEANPDGSQSPADRQPPKEAVDACAGRAEEDVCEFTTPHRGLESGTCALSQEGLACAPQRGEQPGGSSPEGKQSMTHRAMTIEQTVSDEAQRNTIAFDALAFLTGDLCADSFLPPQKWPISLASSIYGTTTRMAWDTTRTS